MVAEKAIDKTIEKVKIKRRHRILWSVVIALAALIVAGLVLTRSHWNNSPLPMSQEAFAAAANAADFSGLIFYEQQLLSTPQRDLLAEEITSRLDAGITLLKANQISRFEVISWIDQLNTIEGFSAVSSQYRERVEEITLQADAFNKGQAALEQGDFAAALAAFAPLAEQNFESHPEGAALYQKALEGLYHEQVALADGKIKSGDFAGALGPVTLLTQYFPNDWRVKNLAFSSTDTVLYEGEVQHLFYHPLIAYPARAFGSKSDSTGQDNYMATVSEFTKVTRQLYDKGYILIDINSLYKARFDETGATLSVTRQPLYLPKGKKPYILSVDDINYYEYMKKDGQVFKLVLNELGDVVTYSKDLHGQDYYGTDNEIIPLLDQFVKDHPDSSMNNAKGTLAVTGFYGILGYRTDDETAAGYQAEKTGALAVVARLKETGWNFASHSQGHRHSNQISLALFKNDTDRWAQEVLPLVGPTSLYVYPFGEGVADTDPKFDYLKKHGFALFCTVSSSSRITFGADYAIQGRRAVDGIALRDKRLYDLLDVPSIIDPIRPSYAKWSQWAQKNHIIP